VHGKDERREKGATRRSRGGASGRASSNRDAFEAVRKAVPGARCAALKPGKTPGGSTNPATDLARAAEVGYRPEHSLETGIAAYIDWLRTNPQ